MYGVCMEYVWSMYGVCMEYVWSMYGVCMEYVWSMYGICMELYMEYVLSMYGVYEYYMDGVCVVVDEWGRRDANPVWAIDVLRTK
jgi:hypothetical protein